MSIPIYHTLLLSNPMGEYDDFVIGQYISWEDCEKALEILEAEYDAFKGDSMKRTQPKELGYKMRSGEDMEFYIKENYSHRETTFESYDVYDMTSTSDHDTIRKMASKKARNGRR